MDQHIETYKRKRENKRTGNTHIDVITTPVVHRTRLWARRSPTALGFGAPDAGMHEICGAEAAKGGQDRGQEDK